MHCKRKYTQTPSLSYAYTIYVFVCTMQWQKVFISSVLDTHIVLNKKQLRLFAYVSLHSVELGHFVHTNPHTPSTQSRHIANDETGRDNKSNVRHTTGEFNSQENSRSHTPCRIHDGRNEIKCSSHEALCFGGSRASHRSGFRLLKRIA